MLAARSSSVPRPLSVPFLLRTSVILTVKLARLSMPAKCQLKHRFRESCFTTCNICPARCFQIIHERTPLNLQLLECDDFAKVCFAQCSTSRLTLGSPGCSFGCSKTSCSVVSIFSAFSMFSTCSELIPHAPIPDQEQHLPISTASIGFLFHLFHLLLIQSTAAAAPEQH